MTTTFTYSVLQYKHSIGLGETINIGVLFYFPKTNTLRFESDRKGHRIKLIYPNFDSFLYKHSIHALSSKIKGIKDIFGQDAIRKGLNTFIDGFILRPDASSFQFAQAATVVDSFPSEDKAIEAYTKLLIPNLDENKHERFKKDEKYIIKEYTKPIYSVNPDLERFFLKDKTVETKHFNLTFDLAWQNGAWNYVKAVGLDLLDESSIQRKGAEYFGYLSELKEYTSQKGAKIDLLVSKPSNNNLLGVYRKTLDFLSTAQGGGDSFEIYKEERIKEYSEHTLQELLKKASS